MSRWDGYWDRRYFPPSQPLTARGGIKSQARRGQFGESWWARRWIGVLESFHIGARLQRGRSYARSGQALTIDIECGLVRARVQGSRPRPYDVTIRMKVLTDAQWRKVEKELVNKPLYAAKLLAGEMPQDIEAIFGQAGVQLFPAASRDLETECSCPDWSNPCKHIAAVYYLLGEEFNRDPFLIFRLRGRAREALTGGLKSPSSPAGMPAAPEAPGDPPPADPSAFWRGAPVPDDLYGEVRIPQIHATLPKRLGNFPFWRGNATLMDSLERIYAAASAAGLDAFLQPATRNPGR
jgi:uncharacterized Zn finger protein